MISGDHQINKNFLANQETIHQLIIQQHLNLFKETNQIQAHKQEVEDLKLFKVRVTD
jgi:hypothetical protein